MGTGIVFLPRSGQALEEQIKTKLVAEFQPDKLVIRNDSGRHIGHAGDNGTGESHFTVYMVSNKFVGTSLVERHRMVYNTLSAELSGSVHALALKLFTPDEYRNQTSDQIVDG